MSAVLLFHSEPLLINYLHASGGTVKSACFEILGSNFISFGSDVGVVLGQKLYIVFQGSREPCVQLRYFVSHEGRYATGPKYNSPTEATCSRAEFATSVTTKGCTRAEPSKKEGEMSLYRCGLVVERTSANKPRPLPMVLGLHFSFWNKLGFLSNPLIRLNLIDSG